MQQRLIIGDIHGCYNELQDLLSRAGLSSGDQIIALGDIVDRGPDTPKIVEFFRNTPGARSLMGNHERKHLKSAKGQVQPALSQVISKAQLGDNYGAALKYFETLPLYLDLPDVILAHAFWEPGVKLAAQKETVLAGVSSGEVYLKEKDLWPWYDHYDGPKPLIVGHRNYGGDGRPFIIKDRVWAIDTSCVRGIRLTGLMLPSFKIISVPAKANHWQIISKAFGGNDENK
jgi:serine/threonine protein phosphatase 1